MSATALKENETQTLSTIDLENLVDAQLAKFNNTEQAEPVSEVKLETATPVYEFDLQEEAPQEQIEEVVQEKTALNITLRTKLIAGVVAVSLVLLATLLIYNAVLIGKLNADITYSEQVLEVEQTRLTSLLDELNSVSEATPEQLNLTKVKNVKVDKLEKLASTEITKDTNWFDAMCEFFSGALGG